MFLPLFLSLSSSFFLSLTTQ
jgi:hypothetical protein